jgi:hypothetical protein
MGNPIPQQWEACPIMDGAQEAVKTNIVETAPQGVLDVPAHARHSIDA